MPSKYSDVCAVTLAQLAWPLRRVLRLPEAQAVVATSPAIDHLLVASISLNRRMVEIGMDPTFPTPQGSPKAPLGAGEPLGFH